MATFLKPSGGSSQPKAHVAIALKPVAPEIEVKPEATAVEPLPEKPAVQEMAWSEKYSKAAVLERARRGDPSSIIRQFDGPDGVTLEFSRLGTGTRSLKAKSWRAMEEDMRPKTRIPFIPAT